ncbi:spore germination protein, partial [Priestia megaterium]|uniref:spore germination protein n=1 Tax=Priestia megaterium TaxID=1404 RepID=UPI0039A1F00C
MTFQIFPQPRLPFPPPLPSPISILPPLLLRQPALQPPLLSPPILILLSITPITNFVSPLYHIAIAVRILP